MKCSKVDLTFLYQMLKNSFNLIGHQLFINCFLSPNSTAYFLCGPI